MTIEEIYKKFDNIGCLSFTTVDENNEPVSRIAHLRAFDNEGIYFMTMFTKDFYKHLKNNGKLSICGLCAKTQVEHDENDFPIFDGGYAIRMTGNVTEVSIADIKAKNNQLFDFCIKDQEIYEAMVVFCIKNGAGDIFDYDFTKEKRENKLERIYFSYNGATNNLKGLLIDSDKCVSCGICKKKCSFLAIKEDDKVYSIDNNRCDECGDCFVNCPVKAISYTK